jgi:predicted TIM-barrel fold metal-dependent hydrolase
LTINVLDDRATATELVRSPISQPVTFAEDDIMRPILAVIQLTSIVCSGVFDRVPDLQFVFNDGGINHATPLSWRLDKDWRSGRVEVPWIKELPSKICRRHGSFISQPGDNTTEGSTPDASLAEISNAKGQLLFGSHLPYVDSVTPAEATAAMAPEETNAVLSGNATARIPRLRQYASSNGR